MRVKYLLIFDSSDISSFIKIREKGTQLTMSEIIDIVLSSFIDSLSLCLISERHSSSKVPVVSAKDLLDEHLISDEYNESDKRSILYVFELLNSEPYNKVWDDLRHLNVSSGQINWRHSDVIVEFT